MKVEQDIYWSDMHPTIIQEARMLELLKACHSAYCWAIDGLSHWRYTITPETLYDVIDHQMKQDWIDERPAITCPWTTMRYMIRMACNNWLDESVLAEKDPDKLAEYLKEKHKDCLYIPHSGMPVKDTVQVERVCRVPIEPVDIPTRIHLVVAHYIDGKWRAEIRAAKAG